METTSETLLERVKDPRDEDAWRAFYGLYQPMLVKYARMQGLRGPEAEDVAQDCMASLARHMRRFRYSRGRGRFREYLRKAANNRIASLRRRRQPRPARADELDALPARTTAEAEWEQLWLREHLSYCLKQVASRHSDGTVRAFRLYALQGWPVQRVCMALSMSANQVYLAKTRMICRLREEVTRMVGDVL
ncbi:MAG: sigma-70 family RNA polymerase sigma factor [Planctomycetota bacterium]